MPNCAVATCKNSNKTTKGSDIKFFTFPKNIDLSKQWIVEDISCAVSLRSVSPKAYRYLKANQYPLPALSTLRNWVSSFDVNQGILKPAVNLMKRKASHFTELEKLVLYLSMKSTYRTR